MFSVPDGHQTGLPKGKYASVDLYCTDLDCDCRNVFIQVVNLESQEVQAVITYGWEPLKFYEEWMGNWEDDQDVIKSFKGPDLAPMTQQSKFAPHWLNLFKEVIQSDEHYRERLKRHYQLVKQSTAQKK